MNDNRRAYHDDVYNADYGRVPDSIIKQAVELGFKILGFSS